MKKLSKTQKQMPQETIGIDLGDKVSRYCVLDPAGEVVEEGSFRNQVSSIETHFAGDPRRIALEAGAQSAWISRELKRLGHEVIVANPRQLKWITASDTKNDPVDARKLALLARADVRLLHPIEHRTAAQQAELSAIRARDAILRARTLLVNAARSMAKGFGLRLPAIDHGELRCASAGRSAARVAPGTEGLVGAHRRTQFENQNLRSAHRRVGCAPSGNRTADQRHGRRHAHGADVYVDAGKCGTVRAQSRCGRIFGAATEAAAKRRPRSAVGDHQERRRVSAQIIGAVFPSHFGSLGEGFGAQKMGIGQKRRRQKGHAASHRRSRAEAGSGAAPDVGDRRKIQTLS